MVPTPAATQAAGVVSPLEQVRAAAGALLREDKVDEAFELVLAGYSPGILCPAGMYFGEVLR
jgi:hypothetical protein